MLVSRSWLQELIDGSLPEAPEVARVLTARGLTVDAIRHAGDDAVFDIDVPANRPDASVREISRTPSGAVSVSMRPKASATVITGPILAVRALPRARSRAPGEAGWAQVWEPREPGRGCLPERRRLQARRVNPPWE